MAKAPKADKAPKATSETPATEASAGKSIINPKYRGKYSKANRDWLAQFIDDHATDEKTVTVVEGDAKVTKKVPGGVNVDKLHALAEKNGLDIEELKAQSGSHGYPGRARMTIRNMLQTHAKQRHGLKNPGGTFVSAPKEFLEAKNAPEAPTHDHNGKKFEKPKAEAAGKKAAATANAAEATA